MFELWRAVGHLALNPNACEFMVNTCATELRNTAEEDYPVIHFESMAQDLMRSQPVFASILALQNFWCTQLRFRMGVYEYAELNRWFANSPEPMRTSLTNYGTILNQAAPPTPLPATDNFLAAAGCLFVDARMRDAFSQPGTNPHTFLDGYALSPGIDESAILFRAYNQFGAGAEADLFFGDQWTGSKICSPSCIYYQGHIHNNW